MKSLGYLILIYIGIFAMTKLMDFLWKKFMIADKLYEKWRSKK